MKEKSKAVQGFYSRTEAAQIAKCSVQTIQLKIKDGTIKAYQPAGPYGTILIPQGNLLRYLTSRQVPVTKSKG